MSKYLPLVSIGIPTLNRAESYFREALESALNQDYANLEIIISDNCSDDGTEDLVEKFRREDNRIKYHRHKERISLNDNFNFCIKKASGKYFLLLHDDDLIDNDHISSCIRGVNSNKEVGIIRTGVRVIDPEGQILYEVKSNGQELSPHEFFLSWFNYLDNSVPIYYCNTLFNTNKLKQIGGLNSKKNLYQEGVAIAKLISRFKHVDISDIKASYRIHNKKFSINEAKLEDWCDDSLYFLNIICENSDKNKELLRSVGKNYFNKRCYLRADQINSNFGKFKAYYLVYKKFNYCYSPIKYKYLLASKKFNIISRKFKRKVNYCLGR